MDDSLGLVSFTSNISRFMRGVNNCFLRPDSPGPASTTLSIHSSSVKHLGFFHSLAIMSNAA